MEKSSINPGGLGLGATLFGSLLWSVGYLSISGVLQQIAVPIIFWGLAYAVLGWRLARQLIIPVIFFYFSIPVWDVLVTPLQGFTTDVTSWFLGVFNIPSYIDGFFIHLPSGVVEVAGGCSGLNYLMAGLVIGFAYSEITLDSRHRLLSMLLVTGLSLLANWIRVISLVVIAYDTEMTHPLITESHVNFGWYIFAATLIIYFLAMHNIISSMTGKTNPINDGGHDCSDGGSTSASDIDVRKMTILIVLSGMVGFGFPQIVKGVGSLMQSMYFDAYLNEDYGYQKSQDFSWVPDYQGYDWAGQWVKPLGGSEITATVLSYKEQWQGKELIAYRNKLAPVAMEKKYGLVRVGERETLASSVVSFRGGNRLMAFWLYRVGGQYTTSSVMAKLLIIRGYVVGDPSSSLIVFSRPCSYDCAQVQDNFTAIAPSIYEFLSTFKIKIGSGQNATDP